MTKTDGLKHLKLIEETRISDPSHDHEWRMIAAFTAKHFGFENRNEWAELLKEVK